MIGNLEYVKISALDQSATRDVVCGDYCRLGPHQPHRRFKAEKHRQSHAYCHRNGS